MKYQLAAALFLPLALCAADLSLAVPNMAFEINADASALSQATR